MRSAGRLSVRRMGGAVLLAAATCLPGAASAKVADASDRGFVIQHLIEVPDDAETVWAMLLKPSAWWDPAHTWSGSAENLSIEPRAGGCFCEVLPSAASPKAAPRGSVEHMRVVYIERPRALRMSGALGPLQSDAVIGTLTFQLKPVDDGKRTQVMLEYIVGGYMRRPGSEMAQAVDGVLGQQIGRLAQKLGGEFANAFGRGFNLPDEKAKQTAIPGVTPLSDMELAPPEKQVQGR